MIYDQARCRGAAGLLKIFNDLIFVVFIIHEQRLGQTTANERVKMRLPPPIRPPAMRSAAMRPPAMRPPAMRPPVRRGRPGLVSAGTPSGLRPAGQKQFFVDNFLVRIHFVIVMIRWTGLAQWEFEFSFPGGIIFTFLVQESMMQVEPITSHDDGIW